MIRQKNPLLQQRVQVVEPNHRANPRDPPGLVCPQPPPIPFLLHLIRPHQHQYLPVTRIGMLREKNDHTVLLHDTRQPKQITALPERIVRIPIRRHFIITDKNGNGTRLQCGSKPRPVFSEQLRYFWIIFHDLQPADFRTRPISEPAKFTTRPNLLNDYQIGVLFRQPLTNVR